MKQIALALCIGATLALSACNTVAGFGQDLSKAGDQLEEAAEDAKN